MHSRDAAPGTPQIEAQPRIDQGPERRATVYRFVSPCKLNSFAAGGATARHCYETNFARFAKFATRSVAAPSDFCHLNQMPGRQLCSGCCRSTSVPDETVSSPKQSLRHGLRPRGERQFCVGPRTSVATAAIRRLLSLVGRTHTIVWVCLTSARRAGEVGAPRQPEGRCWINHRGACRGGSQICARHGDSTLRGCCHWAGPLVALWHSPMASHGLIQQLSSRGCCWLVH